MSDSSNQFDELLELAKRIGITVRHVRLGGNGGGLASFKNKRQLFIDQDATAIDQLEQTVKALGKVEEFQTMFIRPDLRKLMDDWNAGGSTDSTPPMPAGPACGTASERPDEPLATQ